MVLYCYHTATYYSANLYRVVDLIKTDLYFETRHFILFYSLWCLHGIHVTISPTISSTFHRRRWNIVDIVDDEPATRNDNVNDNVNDADVK